MKMQSFERCLRFLRCVAIIGNHDFCPWTNRYVYWLKQPIGWFVVGAVASLLIGLFLAPQGFVMLAAIVAVIVLGVAWPWIGMRGVTCRLQFERTRARENDSVRVKLAIANRWPWPVWGLAVERGFFAEENASGDTPAVALARVAGWSESDFYWEFRPPLRGVYPAEPPRLATGFPFGIWHARRDIVVENELLVWPRTTRLTSIPPVSGRDLTVAGMLSNHVGDEGDFLGVRPYRQGDLLRHIHWAQTARRDSFVVCERQSTARRTVRVTMDVDPTVHRGDRIDGSLEWTIRVGASICQEFLAHSSRVECVVGDRRIVAEPGPNGLKRLLDALAKFSPESQASKSLLPSGEKARKRGDAANRYDSRPPSPQPSPASGRGSNLKTGSEEDCQPVGASLPLPEGALSIVVTTDRGAERIRNGNGSADPSRFVLLRATAFESQMLGVADGLAEWHLGGAAGRKVWMKIDNADDVPGQLRRAWERVCHDDWCAA
jgi:uncharacterized protein (DUF58 family)